MLLATDFKSVVYTNFTTEAYKDGAGWEGRTPDIRRVKALLYHWVNPAQIVKDHGRDTVIRTLDPLLPKQMLYQAELHPESQ